MFTDAVRIKLSAGKGGNGTVAWRREKYIPKGGPAGGNGGNGGSIIIKCDPQIHSLDFFRNRRIIAADNGLQGGAGNRHGKNGKDYTIKVPPGTILRLSETGGTLFDFTHPDEELLICQGGRGGKGNTFFKTPTNQSPIKATPGKLGESKEIDLELKLIADVGLVGFPNAGKSTLLSTLSAVDIKIGAYPFTTLKPNLSYLEFDDFSRIYIADIPGIIPDAHNNKGLGLSFLKHVERSSMLIFIVDITGEEGRDPYEDLQVLINEARAYNQKILEKPYLIALNKIDKACQDDINCFLQKYSGNEKNVFSISALSKSGLAPFVESIRFISQKNGKKYH